LALADLEIIERRLGRLTKEARSTKDPDLLRENELLERCKATIEDGGAIRDLAFEGVPGDAWGFIFKIGDDSALCKNRNGNRPIG